jgi:dephospho-CoA kinase
MKWIGLTGGIATGKSTVARLIESLGHPVIDADQISHQISRFGQTGYEKIVSHFGPQILKENQEIDRKKIAHIIFANTEEKNNLEKILHPLIQAEVQNQKLKHQQNAASHCFYDVPLLFEKKLQNNFDAIVTVWCDAETQQTRLMSRNQLSETEARLRIENQLPLSHKISQSTYCIDNSGSEESLIQIVSNWLETI